MKLKLLLTTLTVLIFYSCTKDLPVEEKDMAGWEILDSASLKVPYKSVTSIVCDKNNAIWFINASVLLCKYNPPDYFSHLIPAAGSDPATMAKHLALDNNISL
jgi:hypothetical protein